MWARYVIFLNFNYVFSSEKQQCFKNNLMGGFEGVRPVGD
jgi:hypothetical protein